MSIIFVLSLFFAFFAKSQFSRMFRRHQIVLSEIGGGDCMGQQDWEDSEGSIHTPHAQENAGAQELPTLPGKKGGGARGGRSDCLPRFIYFPPIFPPVICDHIAH